MFDGREAKELGVCSRVLPNDEVLPAALEVAHDIAANIAPLSVALSKRLLWESFGLDAARRSSARETALHHHLMGATRRARGRARVPRAPPAPVAGTRLPRLAGLTARGAQGVKKCPALTSSTAPVIPDARSDARNRMALAISSGVTMRRSAISPV